MRYDPSHITRVIPHRPPFLLIDSVESVEFGRRGVGVSTLDASCGLFSEYRTGELILPRSLLIEAMAQTAAFVAAGGSVFGETESSEPSAPPGVGYLVRVSGVVFDQNVYAGETVSYIVEMTKSFGDLYKFKGTAEIDGVEIARGELTFSVPRDGSDG
jgi:3-hydroxyacyl-[acyl-carrier-protein] dehydratase